MVFGTVGKRSNHYATRPSTRLCGLHGTNVKWDRPKVTELLVVPKHVNLQGVPIETVRGLIVVKLQTSFQCEAISAHKE